MRACVHKKGEGGGERICDARNAKRSRLIALVIGWPVTLTPSPRPARHRYVGKYVKCVDVEVSGDVNI